MEVIQVEERTGTSGGVLSPGEDDHVVPAVNEAPPEPPMGFLDIIYGVFFDPRATFRRLAASPPLGLAILIFTLVNLAGALMGALVGYRLTLQPGHPYMGMHWLAPAAPLVAVAGLVFQYVKWVVVSALLHLTAGLLDGRGRASGILTITALAALPALAMIPVDLLLFLLDTRGMTLTVVTAILGLAVFIWGVVLVILGLMEVYQFSASRALLTVLLPPAVIILSGIILLVIFAAGISSLFPLNS